ncbi:TlpA family protein disulfide reductase [Eubacteriales bacterium OttesenSCG-928-N13]|nr:TlpA family protein disulfide reductase [Eubacteriales bacterium OttesenSCG-928-N13]
MRYRILSLFMVLLLVMSVSAFAEQEKQPIFDTFVTTDIHGNEQTETLLQNAPLTFFNVWGTFCDPCIREMPDLAALATEYEGKVQFLGIVGDVNFGSGINADLQQLAVEIAEQTGADNYVHLVPSDEMNQRVLYSVRAYPTTFFLDSNGYQVGTAYEGSRSKDDWKLIIDQALASMES